MPTSKASPGTIPMPDDPLPTVRSILYETRMTPREFRFFVGDIRHNTIKHLDDSGFVSIEEQDPAALRHLLDEVKKSNPTIAKRYPYLWPVLAYLELYLVGRRRSYPTRCDRDAIQSTLPKTSPVPIWIRFARSEKSGKSLQEISKTEPDKSPRRSRSTPRRTDRRRPMVRKSYKRETSMETVVDENITEPVDSSPASAGPSSRNIAAPVGYFLRSFGSSIEGICSHFASG